MLDEKKFSKSIYALQVAAQYANRRDALAPDALADLEKQESEDSSEKKGEKKNEYGLAGLLVQTLQDFDNKRGAYENYPDDPKTKSQLLGRKLSRDPKTKSPARCRALCYERVS
jgi:hypothetical protein